jgi:hypothetical protein
MIGARGDAADAAAVASLLEASAAARLARSSV